MQYESNISEVIGTKRPESGITEFAVNGEALSIDLLVSLFNGCFKKTEATVLRSGAEEPLYLPASEDRPFAEIHCRADYVSSALHEISHWCIAGPARRQEVDYGYWYEPDGRDLATQALFEQVEVKPQALEWVFSLACRQKFRLSVDNVANPELGPSRSFAEAVTSQANRYLEQGLPARAQRLLDTMQRRFASADCFQHRPIFRLENVYS